MGLDFKSYAIKYNLFGFKTHPLAARGKVPLWEEWPEKATNDITVTEQTWSAMPTANIGVVFGELYNGYFADLETDINTEVNGETSLLEWCAANGVVLPATATFRSGGGGLHRWFSVPNLIRNSVKILPGVDVRGKGGQSVVPPSVHPNGNTYEWLPGQSFEDFTELPMLPFELLDLLTSRSGGEYKPPLETPEIIPEGERNNTMFRLACQQRSLGLMYEEILHHMEKINETRCSPPLSDEELQTVCEQAAKYERGRNKFIPDTNKLDTYRPKDFTDAGNAEVFTQFAKGLALYTDALGWLSWTGEKWEANEHEVLQLGITLTEKMLEEAGKELGIAREALTTAQTKEDEELAATAAKAEKGAKEYLKHAKAIRARARLEAMLALSIPQFVVPLDSLDANPFDFNTPAGIVDLRTGEMRTHDHRALCAKITAVAPDDTGVEIWTGFLDKITCGDADLVLFLQEMSGMAAIGRVYMEKLIIALGSGGNGKSSFFNAIEKVFGDYAGGINPDVLTGGKQNKGADLANLQGKRLIIAAELEEGKRLSSDMLKRIASTDKIAAERKYKDPESFTPSHSTILFTNHAPRLSAVDNGTKRRICITPFRARISADGEIMDYAQYLFENCGGAILSWVIEGAKSFCAKKYKLESCKAVQKATHEFILSNDWLARFIDECCVIDPQQKTAAGELYQKYAMWSPSTGDPYVRNNNDFAAELERREYTKKREKSGVFWLGIGVKV